ncbi:MAG: tRNA1(Val) (adenine(37)-N6)-methyltransferase [Treponemataceae bacterium]
MKVETLHIKNLKLMQDENSFKFGIDAVILADFASKQIRNNSSVLDLGCGNGIIPILLSADSRAKQITGLEIQKDIAQLAKKNIELNNLSDKIDIINADIKDIRNIFSPETFDSVVTNPPYIKKNSGKQCSNEKINIARSEVLCCLEDVIKAAAFSLKSNGNFFLINRPNRLSETMILLKKYNLGAKNLQLVNPNRNKEPSMFLLQAKKDFYPELKISKNLIICDENGNYTEKLTEIYKNTSSGPNCAYFCN